MVRFVAVAALAALAASAAWGVVGVAVAGGFSMPSGDFNKIVKASPVVDARFLYGVTPTINATAGVAYRLNHESNAELNVEGLRYVFVPVFLGADYRMEFLPCMPYVGGGLALVYSKSSIPAAAAGELEDRATFRVGPYGEFGVEYFFAESVGADVRARFLYAFGGEEVLFKNQPVEAGNYGALDAVVGLFYYF